MNWLYYRGKRGSDFASLYDFNQLVIRMQQGLIFGNDYETISKIYLLDEDSEQEAIKAGRKLYNSNRWLYAGRMLVMSHELRRHMD